MIPNRPSPIRVTESPPSELARTKVVTELSKSSRASSLRALCNSSTPTKATRVTSPSWPVALRCLTVAEARAAKMSLSGTHASRAAAPPLAPDPPANRAPTNRLTALCTGAEAGGHGTFQIEPRLVDQSALQFLDPGQGDQCHLGILAGGLQMLDGGCSPCREAGAVGKPRFPRCGFSPRSVPPGNSQAEIQISRVGCQTVPGQPHRDRRMRAGHPDVRFLDALVPTRDRKSTRLNSSH